MGGYQVGQPVVSAGAASRGGEQRASRPIQAASITAWRTAASGVCASQRWRAIKHRAIGGEGKTARRPAVPCRAVRVIRAIESPTGMVERIAVSSFSSLRKLDD